MYYCASLYNEGYSLGFSRILAPPPRELLQLLEIESPTKCSSCYDALTSKAIFVRPRVVPKKKHNSMQCTSYNRVQDSLQTLYSYNAWVKPTSNVYLPWKSSLDNEDASHSLVISGSGAAGATSLGIPPDPDNGPAPSYEAPVNLTNWNYLMHPLAYRTPPTWLD